MSVGVRITYGGKSSRLMYNLGRSYSKMMKHQTQLSDGKKIHRPSDNPINVTNALGVRTKKAQNEQYTRNIEDGRAYLMTNDTTILTSVDYMQRSRELAIQGRNETLSPSERNYIGQEVVQIVNNLLQQANTRFKGDYIFNGTQTQTPPYELRQATNDEMVLDPANIDNPIQIGQDYAPSTSRIIPLSLSVTDASAATTYTEGVDYEVNYITGEFTALSGGALDTGVNEDILISYKSIQNSIHTNDEEVFRQISEDSKIGINLSASEVFENRSRGEDVFRTLIGLAEGLIKDDSDKIGESINLIDNSKDNLLKASAKNGAKINVFDQEIFSLRKQDVDLANLMGEYEDIDYAKVISEFHMQQNLFQASMQAASSIIQPFLGNYI